MEQVYEKARNRNIHTHTIHLFRDRERMRQIRIDPLSVVYLLCARSMRDHFKLI